jgi:hypothetical protein
MASSDIYERYVILPGLCLPVEPVELGLELERRGFTLRREGEDTLSVQPHQQLTREDCRRIRQWKQHLLAIVDYAAAQPEARH